MSNLAIIPARGGSKRIPRKNIKEFNGKPIILYSIETAIKSGLFDEVMVSTDDDEIAEIAIKAGVKVPFKRSEKASDDYATTADVINEVIFEYKKRGKIFINTCCIYPAAPLIQIKHINEGLVKLIDKKLSSVFPVVKFGYPVWRGVYINEQEKVSMVWPEYVNSRSQDLTSVYHDAGQWYWFVINDIRHSLFTDNTESIILDETEIQDIDTLSDWKIAELKYRLINEIKI